MSCDIYSVVVNVADFMVVEVDFSGVSFCEGLDSFAGTILASLGGGDDGVTVEYDSLVSCKSRWILTCILLRKGLCV